MARALVGDGSQPPGATLGILPLGTANDFAHGCGLPVEDLTACLTIAATRAARNIDVGMVNKRPFINVASGGFGAEITATTPVEWKRALGGGAYALMGLIKAKELSPYPVTLKVPGRPDNEARMLFMAVGNNRFAGGGFEVAKRSSMTDGLLDLTAILQAERLDPARLKQEFDDPANPDNQHLFYDQLAEFTIESPDKLQLNLDGEPYRKRRLHFRVLPGHLGVAY